MLQVGIHIETRLHVNVSIATTHLLPALALHASILLADGQIEILQACHGQSESVDIELALLLQKLAVGAVFNNPALVYNREIVGIAQG